MWQHWLSQQDRHYYPLFLVEEIIVKTLLIPFKMFISFDLVIPQPILRKYLETAKKFIHRLSTEVLLIKQNRRWLNKLWYVCMVEYYTGIKNDFVQRILNIRKWQ